MDITNYAIFYVICEIITLNAFFEQRAALEIGRKMGMDIRRIARPFWYPLVWIPRIARWAAWFYLFTHHGIFLTVILIALDLGITTFLPVPNSKYQHVQDRLREHGIY